MGIKPAYLRYLEKNEPDPMILSAELRKIPEVWDTLGLNFSEHFTYSPAGSIKKIFRHLEFLREMNVISEEDTGPLEAISQSYSARRWDLFLGLSWKLTEDLMKRFEGQSVERTVLNGILVGYPEADIRLLAEAKASGRPVESFYPSLYPVDTEFKDLGILTAVHSTLEHQRATWSYLQRMKETLYYAYSLIRNNPDFPDLAGPLNLPPTVFSQQPDREFRVRSEVRMSDVEKLLAHLDLIVANYKKAASIRLDHKTNQYWTTPAGNYIAAALAPERPPGTILELLRAIETSIDIETSVLSDPAAREDLKFVLENFLNIVYLYKKFFRKYDDPYSKILLGGILITPLFSKKDPEEPFEAFRIKKLEKKDLRRGAVTSFTRKEILSRSELRNEAFSRRQFEEGTRPNKKDMSSIYRAILYLADPANPRSGAEVDEIPAPVVRLRAKGLTSGKLFHAAGIVKADLSKAPFGYLELEYEKISDLNSLLTLPSQKAIKSFMRAKAFARIVLILSPHFSDLKNPEKLGIFVIPIALDKPFGDLAVPEHLDIFRHFEPPAEPPLLDSRSEIRSYSGNRIRPIPPSEMPAKLEALIPGNKIFKNVAGSNHVIQVILRNPKPAKGFAGYRLEYDPDERALSVQFYLPANDAEEYSAGPLRFLLGQNRAEIYEKERELLAYEGRTFIAGTFDELGAPRIVVSDPFYDTLLTRWAGVFYYYPNVAGFILRSGVILKESEAIRRLEAGPNSLPGLELVKIPLVEVMEHEGLLIVRIRGEKPFHASDLEGLWKGLSPLQPRRIKQVIFDPERQLLEIQTQNGKWAFIRNEDGPKEIEKAIRLGLAGVVRRSELRDKHKRIFSQSVDFKRLALALLPQKSGGKLNGIFDVNPFLPLLGKYRQGRERFENDLLAEIDRLIEQARFAVMKNLDADSQGVPQRRPVGIQADSPDFLRGVTAGINLAMNPLFYRNRLPKELVERAGKQMNIQLRKIEKRRPVLPGPDQLVPVASLGGETGGVNEIFRLLRITNLEKIKNPEVLEWLGKLTIRLLVPVSDFYRAFDIKHNPDPEKISEEISKLLRQADLGGYGPLLSMIRRGNEIEFGMDAKRAEAFYQEQIYRHLAAAA